MPAPSADVEAFLREPHVATLSTVRPDGRPHVTPVWYDFDGREFTVSTFRTTQKLKNVSHKGFAALCIFTHEPPYRNVIVQAPPASAAPWTTSGGSASLHAIWASTPVASTSRRPPTGTSSPSTSGPCAGPAPASKG